DVCSSDLARRRWTGCWPRPRRPEPSAGRRCWPWGITTGCGPTPRPRPPGCGCGREAGPKRDRWEVAMPAESKLAALVEQGCTVFYFYSTEPYLVRQAVGAADRKSVV